METLKKYWKVAVAIALLLIGFFIGRQTSEVKTSVKMIPGKTVIDTLYSEQLSPYHSEIPNNPILPLKPDAIRIKGDSVPYAVIMKTDTAKIIQNYITKNSYRKQLFNDDNGKLIVSADVQYNLLQKLSYDFTPMQKVTTVEKKRVFTPFLIGSYNSWGYLGAGAGIYYYDVGVSAKYLTNFINTGYEVSLHIKF
jgi:hypothetical protein